MAVPSGDVASRRLPLSWILGATALALVAAAGVVLLAGTGGSDGAGDESAADQTVDAGTLGLVPEEDLPPSIHDVQLGSLDGGAARPLHDHMDGRPIVVNFFASWCQPCIEEMPAFERVHQDVGDRVTFLGLATRNRLSEARETVRERGVTYPTYADADGVAWTYLGGRVMPATVFLSPDGDVLEVRNRPLTEEQLRARLDEHYGVTAAPRGTGSAGDAGGGGG
jgi:thiol-disulfide isomerase/thioredoxin